MRVMVTRWQTRESGSPKCVCDKDCVTSRCAPDVQLGVNPPSISVGAEVACAARPHS